MFTPALFLILLPSMVLAQSPSPPSTSSDEEVAMAWAAYVTLTVIVYAAIVVCTWPVVRMRLPLFPLFAVLLLVLVPPAFFIILFYLLIFRLVFWTAFRPIAVAYPATAVVVMEEAFPHNMSQVERAAMRA